MKITKLIKLLRKLPDAKIEELISKLGEEESVVEPEVEEVAEETEEVETDAEEAEGEEVEEEGEVTETEEGEEGGEEEVAEDTEESEEVEATESEVENTEEVDDGSEEEVVMQKGVPEQDEEEEIEEVDEGVDQMVDGEVDETVTDAEGEKMPIDYQDIIDGLNAKILAQDNEIKRLRAKCEGAFGVMAKSRANVKRNALYDDDVSDVKMMKI